MSLRGSVNLTDLQMSLETLNVAALKSMGTKLGISVEGGKADLINRLVKRLKTNAAMKFDESLTVRNEEAALNYRVDGIVIQKKMKSEDWMIEFLPKSIGGYEWILGFQPDESDSKYMFVYLEGVDVDSAPPMAYFEYSLRKINEDSGAVVAQEFKRFPEPKIFGGGFKRWGWQSLKIQDLKADLHRCRLEIECKIIVYGENESVESAQFEPRVMNLGQLIQDNVDSDFNIVLKDETIIPVHRLVLEAASPVMKAMFGHALRENLDDRMTIDDFKPAVVRMFIASLYKGMLSKDCDFKQMFAIADKYKVGSLAEKCLLELSKKLTVENACFILGSMKRCNYYQGTVHEERVSRFINDNFDEIESTDDFQAVSKDPVLLLSILRQRGRGKKRKREET